MNWLDMCAKLVVTVPAEQTGPGPSDELGGGGWRHRGQIGDIKRIPQPVKPNVIRTRSLMGRPSGQHASPWSEQSGHRNALSPAQRVSPGQRAASPTLSAQRTSGCCTRHASRSPRHPAPAGQAERQAGYQTAQYQGLIAGWAVGSARGMPKGMAGVS